MRHLRIVVERTAKSAWREGRSAAALAAILYDRCDDGWAWRCDGCWIGSGLPSLAAAQEEARSHVVNDHDRMERVPDA